MSNGQDPRITDLNRYRKARDRARRRPPPKPQAPPRQSFLGPRKNAGLILVAVIAVLLALYVLPRLL